MIERKTSDKLPIQGNVYPMSSMSYIEDDSIRLTILSGQPSGIACLKSGKFNQITRVNPRSLIFDKFVSDESNVHCSLPFD